MPGSALIWSAWSRVMTLCISACEPTRSVMTFRVEALTESVRVTPWTRARTQRKTATTRPMTKTVIPVETRLTKRLRKLYLRGRAISDHLAQPIDDLHPRRPDRRNEPREDSHPDRNAER